jgi:UDPglucose 6-dehydrogenase
VKAARGRNLFIDTDTDKDLKESEIIFVSVNTPTKTFGAGTGMAAHLQYREKTARQIREAAESPKIVVEKCTIPVRTALAMERILTSKGNYIHFEILSNPEFLAEGTAMKNFEFPIGSPHPFP